MDIRLRRYDPERAAELYRTADTPEDAAELLKASGMPELANYVLLICDYTRPTMRADWANEKAELCERGDPPGAAAFRERPPAVVALALRWVAVVCERGLGKALERWAKRET